MFADEDQAIGRDLKLLSTVAKYLQASLVLTSQPESML